MNSEAIGIDSESLLFAKLQEYRKEIPNLISRRQYNDRRKITSSLCNAVRERIVKEMDGGAGENMRRTFRGSGFVGKEKCRKE